MPSRGWVTVAPYREGYSVRLLPFLPQKFLPLYIRLPVPPYVPLPFGWIGVNVKGTVVWVPFLVGGMSCVPSWHARRDLIRTDRQLEKTYATQWALFWSVWCLLGSSFGHFRGWAWGIVCCFSALYNRGICIFAWTKWLLVIPCLDVWYNVFCIFSPFSAFFQLSIWRNLARLHHFYSQFNACISANGTLHSSQLSRKWK